MAVGKIHKEKVKALSREKFDNDSHYTVDLTDNGYRGFCLMIEWEELNEEKSLEFISDAFAYIDAFEPDSVRYPDEDGRAMVTGAAGDTKILTAGLRKQIFEERLYRFGTERWSFYD